MVTHPSTNWARHRLTSLIKTNALPLGQTTTGGVCVYSSLQCFWWRQQGIWHVKKSLLQRFSFTVSAGRKWRETGKLKFTWKKVATTAWMYLCVTAQPQLSTGKLRSTITSKIWELNGSRKHHKNKSHLVQNASNQSSSYLEVLTQALHPSLRLTKTPHNGINVRNENQTATAATRQS